MCKTYDESKGGDTRELQSRMVTPPKKLGRVTLIRRLTLSQIIPQNYKINISTGFGLTPDASKNHNQINFCLLLARHYIWIRKNKKAPPFIQDFLHYLKSTYLLKLKPGDGRSNYWELFQTLS